MLMVIFGAGASYDSWPSLRGGRTPRGSEPFRPPLAKELFVNVQQFRAVSARYARCQPLIPYLESRENVEEILEQFRDESEQSEERRRQLLAIQFYIREIIRLCETHWRKETCGVTNYRTFVDQVQAFPEVCFVTFNYDTLLEDALEAIDVRFPTIREYISERYKVFKLHGSTNWKLWLRTQRSLRGAGQPADEELIRTAPKVFQGTSIRKEAEPGPQSPDYVYWYLPALAIPTLSKSSFVCPSEHVDDLRECVERVSQIAIVGWRGGEKHFLEILAKGLKSSVDVIAACGNEQAASDTLKNLRNAGVPIRNAMQSVDGFTDFVLNRGVNWLLQQRP